MNPTALAVKLPVNYNHIYLGCYRTEDEAAHAYNKAAIHAHGDFAVLNPVGECPRYAV